MGAPLLLRLHGLIDRTYDLGTSDVDAASFVIGDEGLARLYGRRAAAGRSLSAPEGAMLLVRHEDGEPRARVYYPDRLIESLEANDPTRGLNDENLRDLATFVEELDHLLVVLSRFRRGRAVRAVELETHANVTKVLVACLFLARTLGVESLGEGERRDVRHELLGRGDYAAEEPWLAERYRHARRVALRFLERLDALPRAERPALLRRFSLAPLSEEPAGR